MNEPEGDDPIAAAVRRTREEIAAMCDYDYKRIAEYVRQQRYRDTRADDEKAT